VIVDPKNKSYLSSLHEIAAALRKLPQEKIRALIANAEREAAGIVAPQAVRDGAQRTLAEHLRAFLDDLKSRGRSKTTLRHYRNVLTKLFTRCRWVRFADVTPASFCAWRATSKLSPKFQNDQLGVMLKAGSITSSSDFER
jgi:hypothetical protein